MKEPEIREVGLSDLPDVVPISDKYNRPGSSTFHEDFFDWQFNAAAAVAGAEDNGALATFVGDKAVGYFFVSKANARCRGTVVPGGWIYEIFVDPMYSGIGFQMLSKHIERNPFLGISGASVDSMNLFLRIRPTTWSELHRMYAVFDTDACSSLLCVKKDKTLKLLEMFSAPKRSGAASIEFIDSFDDNYDSLWQKVGYNYVFTIDRSADYMNWRYVEHPRFDYFKVVCESPSGPAFYIWREEKVSDHDAVVFRLCDIVGEPDAITDSLPTVLSTMRDRGAAFCDFFCSNYETVCALNRGGMHPVITTPYLDMPRLFSPLHDDVRKTLNFAYNFARGTGPEDFKCFPSSYITRSDANQDRPNP